MHCFIFFFMIYEITQYTRYLEAVDQRCSVKKGVLRNFTKFTGKHLCQSVFFNKVVSD